VNANVDEDPATINRLICELFELFRRRTYVAYTATPFANLFINPDIDNLFPSNFIYALNAPDNYVGAASIFGEDGPHAKQLREIDDAEEMIPLRHKNGLLINEIPLTLKKAIYSFLIATTVRDLRKERLQHRSMLVNVSRFTSVQNQIANQIDRVLYETVAAVQQYLADSQWRNHEVLHDLYVEWLGHFKDCEVSWDTVRSQMYHSIGSIKVVTINQQAERNNRLNYDRYQGEIGRRVIAVGGLTLSRGLTLEGLSTSYFYRNSKAYDTLLQMGRWFGYRGGYDDLSTIWMSEDAQGWFSHIAEVVGELRNDIRRMFAMRQPPSQFGMRVRSHPGALIVTAVNKMRNAQNVNVAVSYSGEGTETAYLPAGNQGNDNLHNYDLALRFLRTLGSPDNSITRIGWRSVSAELVADFLQGLRLPEQNMHFMRGKGQTAGPLIDFIRLAAVDQLSTWDICLATGSGDEIKEISSIVGTSFKTKLRTFEAGGVEAGFVKVQKQRVGDTSDLTVFLNDAERKLAREQWEAFRSEQANKQNVFGASPPGYFYRRGVESHSKGFIERPLLLIYVIQPKTEKDSPKSTPILRPTSRDIGAEYLVAVGLHFPMFEDTDRTQVTYALNRVSLRELGMLEEEGDD
jgi:hypothetical protein